MLGLFKLMQPTDYLVYSDVSNGSTVNTYKGSSFCGRQMETLISYTNHAETLVKCRLVGTVVFAFGSLSHCWLSMNLDVVGSSGAGLYALRDMVDLQKLATSSRSSLRFQVMKLMADMPVWRADQ
jgi:hypothetical protein